MTSPESDGTWIVYSDGASRGNPGNASMGAVVIDPSGRVRKEVSERLGITTNNIAEYSGLIAGLEAALDLGARRVEARMDSELVARQAVGRYKVRSPGLLPLYHHLMDLLPRFDAVSFQHVPRAQNKLADALANEALDRADAP